MRVIVALMTILLALPVLADDDSDMDAWVAFSSEDAVSVGWSYDYLGVELTRYTNLEVPYACRQRCGWGTCYADEDTWGVDALGFWPFSPDWWGYGGVGVVDDPLADRLKLTAQAGVRWYSQVVFVGAGWQRALGEDAAKVSVGWAW